MSEVSLRFEKVAAGFTERVKAVPDHAWDNPAPCEGWVARDVVRHLVEWVPGFFEGRFGYDLPPIPPVDEDPARAWECLRDGLQAGLDDPAVAGQDDELPRIGHSTFEAAVDQFVTGDVLVHTWDVARACGLDEVLDPVEVHRMLEGMVPYEEAMRGSGHYGPRVEVAEDADEQTKMIAFTGRRP